MHCRSCAAVPDALLARQWAAAVHCCGRAKVGQTPSMLVQPTLQCSTSSRLSAHKNTATEPSIRLDHKCCNACCLSTSAWLIPHEINIKLGMALVVVGITLLVRDWPAMADASWRYLSSSVSTATSSSLLRLCTSLNSVGTLAGRTGLSALCWELPAARQQLLKSVHSAQREWILQHSDP